MTRLAGVVGQLVLAGGWAPLAVFVLHVVLDVGLDAYAWWPDADVPMHVVGGAAMAYFMVRAVRLLVPAASGPARAVELTLASGLTALTAVVWEVAEFLLDRAVGTRLQVSEADTVLDLALGILGAAAYLVGRARSAPPPE